MVKKVEDGDSSDRQEKDGAARVYRIRIMDPVLLSCASAIIGFLSYLGTTSSRQAADRKAEYAAIRVECKDFTNTAVNNLAGTLNDFRRTYELREDKQDDEIKTLRQIWLQMRK